MREESVPQLHKTWEDAGKTAPSRQYGLDLLRILSMMMVVSLHLLGKGGFLEGLTGPMGTRDYLAFLLEINKCFDDHQALRLWLQRMLDEGKAHYDDLAQQARVRLMSLAHS